jgi:hypothetical protein
MRDFELFDEEEEYLKRFYKNNEHVNKIMALTEYYKYHKDVARIFKQPVCHIMNRFHDKKRHLEYLRLKKVLNLESSEESIKSD